MVSFWLVFSAGAYILTVLSIIIVWRKAWMKNRSIVELFKKWPLVDKILLGIWAIQLCLVVYTRRPESFALNSVLLLYLVSRINKEILQKKN